MAGARGDPTNRPHVARSASGEICLDPAWARVQVELDERLAVDAANAPRLPGIDHGDVARVGLELLSVPPRSGNLGSPFRGTTGDRAPMALTPRARKRGDEGHRDEDLNEDERHDQ